MKTFAQFIKENSHIQEKLDAEVYGELRYGAPDVRQKSKKEISGMVGKAIDHAKAGTVDKTKGTPARKRKLSFGGSVSLAYEKKSGSGKTPPTKVRPDKTTDPKGTKVKPDKPKNTNKFGGKTIKTTTKIKTVKAVKGNGGRPNKPSNDVRPIKTSTPPPSTSSSSTNVLTKGSNTSSPSTSTSPSPSPSTSVLQKGKTKPSIPVRPVREV